MKCHRCEVLPKALPEKGYLYISPAVAPTGMAIKSYLRKLKLKYREIYPTIYEVILTDGALRTLCVEYLCNVSLLEMADTKCLVLGENESFSVDMLLRMQPLSELVARIQGGWLIRILEEKRLEAWFQPIVHADAPTRAFAHECLIRGRDEDGGLISPADIFGVAKSADLLFNLDRACRMTAIRDAARHKIDTNIFVNFNPSTIYDPDYCLRSTMQAIDESGIANERIVFEVVESEEVRDTEHLLGILKYYRENGFRIAMDDLGAGYSSLNLLSRLRPDFVKMDMELIRDVDKDRYKSIISANMLNLAKELGVKVIAEGIETVGEWQWLVEHGADYLQGFLFAKPAAPPITPKAPAVPADGPRRASKASTNTVSRESADGVRGPDASL